MAISGDMETQAARPAAPPSAGRAVAVIDIGTTSIRMAVAEIDPQGKVRPLDALSMAVSLGKDTFTKGYIEKSTIEDAVRVLKSYRRHLREYGITSSEQLRVVATSAVREAENRLAFIDRIYIATGLQVDPIDEAEVNRVTYHGILPFVQSQPSLAEGRTVVIEVGGGSTELLVLQGTDVVFARSYRLGSLRLRKTLEAYSAPTARVRQIMERQIRRVVDQIRDHVAAEGPVKMIALGGDVRFAAKQLDPHWDHNSLASILLDDFEELTDQMLRRTLDELVQTYHLSFPDAETIGPALLSYALLARALGVSQILVSNTNLRDGLLQEMATRDAWTDDFVAQIVRSALDLGRRFAFDERHACHVAELAKKLFEQLASEHQLEARWGWILYLAALLHEIGLYVGQSAYHKHTQYLIRNSELFGLGKNDLLLVSLVARYHRRASPQPTHEGYATLDRDQRVAVCKLAALLRVAKALDESRSQRIKDFRAVVTDGKLEIRIPNVSDLSLEQLALRQGGTLFEEVYGMPVLLRSVRGKR